jgi:hypothetical protein
MKGIIEHMNAKRTYDIIKTEGGDYKKYLIVNTIIYYDKTHYGDRCENCLFYLIIIMNSNNSMRLKGYIINHCRLFA